MANRPKYLNLMQIRLPLPAVISIMHRVSGAVLFLALPLLLWWLQRSLTSGRTFAEIQNLFSFWPVKLIFIGLIWGYFHHLCAGIRHVVMDLHFGLELRMVRLSSMIVLYAGIVLTFIAGAMIW
jgi:succinate dehydrogenase / fumarate reductase, cytochrome b subunit